MMTTMEEQLYIFYQFPDSKNHWEEKYFLKFLVPRKDFKKGEFCQFLASKIYEKIWHCFNIFCNFCISENFGMSPGSDAQTIHFWDAETLTQIGELLRGHTLQTSQSFLLQKMPQKTLKICVIMPAFFEPRNDGKI